MPTQREREKQEQKKSGSAKAWADSVGNSWTPTDLAIPKGLEPYELKAGQPLMFDIIPFLAGLSYGVKNPRADPGFQHWERQFSVHNVPNAAGKSDRYCCLYENWKETCPVCQYRNGLSDKELADKLRPQQRHLFLVNEYPGRAPGPKNPLKLLNTVFYNRKLGFGEQLKVSINSYRGHNAEELDPSDLNDGVTLCVTVVDEKYKQVGRIDFVERQYAYPESVLEHGYCLDEFLIKSDPDALRELVGMEAAAAKVSVSRPAEDALPPRTSAPQRNGAKNLVQEDDAADEDDGMLPPKKPAGKKQTVEYDADILPLKKPEGKAPVVEPDDDDVPLDDEDADPFGDDDIDDDDAPPEPPKKRGRPKK